MKGTLLIGLLLFIPLIHFSQTDSANVRFILVSESVNPDSENVYITGSSKNLGGWLPDVVMLERLNDSTFSKKIKLPLNQPIEFKFTKGSWETEALDESGNVMSNFSLTLNRDTTLFFEIHKWKDGIPRASSGQITGNVEYIEKLKTNPLLLKRDVIIWLPPGYDENENQRYPVLYMHDGQNIIDPETSFLGIDWQIDETADTLIRKNIIEPIIIIGIYNTMKRSVEYSENDTGYAYVEFLANDLKPMIDAQYRTKPGRENTAVAGSSMGGLISFIVAWERPDIFSMAASLSPAFKIRQYDFVDNVEFYQGEVKDLKFYIDNGGVTLEDSLQKGVDEMINALSKKGYEIGKDIYYFKDAEAEHNEAAWAERTWRFLKIFFGVE